MKVNTSIKLILALVICQAAGLIGSIFTAPAIPRWYASLVKPSFNPPNWVFGPVWIMLYVLMGVSLFLVWKQEGRKTKVAIYVFFLQLALNTAWSPLFFGLEMPLAAFVVIILLWIAILVTILKFYKFSKLASYLLVPYILWVSFAAVLNFFLWFLN
jgi:tryptophan-rich sensory protein